MSAKSEILEGYECWMELNDCFGSRQRVKVIRLYTGGNALVHDGERYIQWAISSLRPIREKMEGGKRD